MKRLAVVVAALLVVALGAPASAAAPVRAMWVWDRPAARSLVAFARDQGVQDLFVAVPAEIGPALPWYRDLRSRTLAAGIRVHALGGDPGWVDQPGAALAWQRGALATGLFDGVHVDVEPWLHPAWDTDRAGVVTRYLDLLAGLNADTALPFEADVAFWLDQVAAPSGGRLDEAVLARVDAITVMSYRDTATGPDSITGVGAAALDAAARAGKPARLAVETNFLGADPVSQKQTFHGQTRAAMAAVLAAVDAASAGSAAYRGVSVHDRAGWTAMRR